MPRKDVYPLEIPSAGFSCEPHALNLLADLALGSCVLSFIPKDSGIIPTDPSNPRESGIPKPKSPRLSADHKYHRMEKLGKKSTGISPNPPPEKPDPTEKSSGILSRSSVNPVPTVFQVSPWREALEFPEGSKHSIISAEHSYASPMPKNLRKFPNPKGNASLSRNASGSVPAAPLVGKVLPFRHQSSSVEPAQSVGRKKEDFSRRHTVVFSGNSVQVTCRWEGEYLFHLDSRYTNNALEKCVIRALHG